MTKLGRNEPCYCGSGKKYKKCHMKLDQEKEKERRRWLEAARYLRRDILAYARDDRFAEAFAAALPRYWNGYYDIDNAEQMSQAEAMRFFDWFMFDVTLDDGKRPLDVYREERRGDLSTEQRQVLDRWVSDVTPASAYVLDGYDAEKLVLREYVTGNLFEVAEPGGRGLVEIGEVILCRLVPVYDHLEFSTSAAYLPADEIADLAHKVSTAQTADAEEHGEAAYEEFLHRNNTLFIHHALEQAKKKGRPPVARLDPDRPDKMMQKAVRAAARRRM